MNDVFKILQNDRTVLFSLMAATMLTIAHAAILTLSYSSLPPFLPLFNQLPWGEERLGEKHLVFLPLALAASSLLGNSFLSTALYRRVSLVSRMSAVTALLVSVLALLFVIRTILVVT